MARYRLSRQAQADIRGIKVFIARDNPVRALSYVQELRAKIEALAQAPLIYRERPELMAGVRAARHGNYLIFFRVNEDLVDVLRVRHGATDFDDLFQP